MKQKSDAVKTLASLLRATDAPCPVFLLGSGASFRSGVPMASEAVKQIARRVYSERELGGRRPPERIKPTEWETWLQGFPWFVRGADRFADNFPLVVEHLLTPAEFRKTVLLDLMRPQNGISHGYRVLADLVMRGLTRTILTTNFDTCIVDALKTRQPHIRHIHEVNRAPGDYDQFSVYSKCQVVWLHGRAEQYSDKNQLGEINALDAGLLDKLRPVLDASPIIVIGYRGAEPSIMDGLFGQSKQGRLDFPNGIFWCLRQGDTGHPNVESLGRRLGPNFTFLEIAGFDEVLTELGTQLAGEDRYSSESRSGAGTVRDLLFDERIVPGVSLEDLDLDLALSVMQEYCRKLGRALVTTETLPSLMREQGLLVQEADKDHVSAGALLLFGKQPQLVFPHAVISLTEAGKKREIYEGNLISQHRQLLARLEAVDINPPLKVKGKRQHNERLAYPPRVLVELLVNMLVHRDYEMPDPAEVEIRPGAKITFENPGGLTTDLATRVTVQNDGQFVLSEALSDQRNPSLCDIFFGLSAMERAGTGLHDVSELMLSSGGTATFFNLEKQARFSVQVAQPQASAGSRSVARSNVPTGLYVLNAIPFNVVPESVSIIRLTVPFVERPKGIDLRSAGTFVVRGNEIWSFAPLKVLTESFESILDRDESKVESRTALETSSDSKKVLSWLLRKHWERHLLTFVGEGLVVEKSRKHRAYFEGKDKGSRLVVWSSPQRRNIRHEVVKKRGEDSRQWFENEGFGYEIITLDDCWCVRIKPFYMFTGRDARTPLPAFTRTARSTRRIKFDRNKNVEGDLTFWSTYFSRGGETINVGDEHVPDLILASSFLTIEVPEIGLLKDDSEYQNRLSA